jgi:hypothetical protein
MKAIWLMLMLLFLALSMGLAGIVFDRYEKPTTGEARYHDAENVVAYQEQTTEVWGIMLGASLFLTGVFAYLAFGSRRRKKSKSRRSSRSRSSFSTKKT